MAHPLSSFGALHTVISLVPVIAGLYSFMRSGKIDPATRSGKTYLIGLALSVFTAFGLSSTGGFNPGHALGILALLAIGGGLLAPRLSFLGRLRPYLSAYALSFSFFLLMVPGINETLTRLPAAHPLANGPESPVVLGTLLAWLVVFIAGVAVQTWLIRSRRTGEASA
ncbi:hypothetical protein [Piscinibacter terrae]|uniref:DUF2306 domain-containing protein n=1 Tax=Piscinibacter terrae TaxID=2496871 RepID=A0A3N7JR55_9BURK|nr:hypothetical protein [Albitalea terrae]RQP21525.1 hypothetical protein DZC73_26785 [Albitalea terrae]